MPPSLYHLATDDKATQIADYLHGSIPITFLEKAVLSTELFNRLHNVLQNSTVYLTYPSNRTSRFAHSVGCMHLASTMFVNAFHNAAPATQTAFLAELDSAVRELAQGSTFRDCVKLIEAEVATEVDGLTTPPSDPLLHSLLPSVLRDEKDRYRFLLALQALRLVGLVHDLGHPPFSHVAESALEELYKEVAQKKADGKHLTDREKSFDKILGHYLQSDRRGIHEEIGFKLVEAVLDTAGKLLAGVRETDKLFACLARAFSISILRSDAPLYRALHAIVDSDLDSDRLDYIPRDASMAGFDESRIRYQRLFHTYTLRQNMSGGGFRFLPSAQALSTIERFFAARLNLYKFVVFHHRVAKTDGLLREAIVQMGRLYLTSRKKDTEVAPGSLPSDISGLWRALNPDRSFSRFEQARYLSQWDDAWLITILRDFFYTPRKHRRHYSEGGDEVELLETQLAELLSSAKRYHSLFKRIDGFCTVEEAFLDRLNEGGPFLAGAAKRIAHSKATSEPSDIDLIATERLLHECQRYVEEWQRERTSPGRLREQWGFLIPRLLRLITFLGVGGATLRDFLPLATHDLMEIPGVRDVFVVERTLKTGVSGSFELDAGDRVVTLSEVTQIARDLEAQVLFFPPFFVYLYSTNEFDEEGLRTLRRRLGENLADRLVEVDRKLDQEV